MGKRLFVCGGILALFFAMLMSGAAQTPAPAKASAPPPAAKQAVTNQPAESAPVDAPGHKLLDLLQRGGPIMYPLYVCSILMLTFWIERFITLRRSKVIPAEIMQCMQVASDSNDPAVRQQMLEKIQANDSPMGRIVRAGLRKADRPALELEKAIEDAGAKEMARMQRNNKVLSSVASIAPLLGLLGTVTGLMRSFMTVALSSEALGRTELLAGGIYEALVATAVGLSIAIPSMALYFYYQERVDQLVGDIDDVAVEMLEKIFPAAKSGGTP